MRYVAIITLELNGNTYHSGDVIANDDVPTTKLRSFVDKGLIDLVGDDTTIAIDLESYKALVAGVADFDEFKAAIAEL